MDGYQLIYGDAAEEQVEAIFSKVDADNSGTIQYAEWVIATINKQKLLTPERLVQAFKLFDVDNGGSISADEIKQKLCQDQDIDDELFNQIINEIDKDKSGEIDQEEFNAMMHKFLEDPDGSESNG